MNKWWHNAVIEFLAWFLAGLALWGISWVVIWIFLSAVSFFRIFF